MTPQEATPQAVAGVLRDSAYLRERQAPKPADATYLHLRDLLTFLQRHRSNEPLRILDYGCGGSPYRQLFPHAEYHRADNEAAEPGLSFVLGADGAVPAPSSHYDLILSTQVLEHVAIPDRHLAECLRLLRPGGRLLLSTHGTYEDHGCPADYHRWTADGLRHALTQAAFEVQEITKLTCSGRALVQLLTHHHGGLHGPRWHPYGAWAAGTRFLFRRFRSAMHRWSDRFQSDYALQPADEGGMVLYLGLGALARKPA